MESDSDTRNEIYRKYLDRRMAEQIRESSQELRALETQIRAAYVTKSLHAQLLEKEKLHLEEQCQRQKEIEQLNHALAANAEKQRQQKELAKVEQIKLRGELQQQIVEKHRQRKLLYEEFLKEKIVIDEILRKIQLEQIEESQQKLLQSQCLRQDMDQLKCEQTKWKIEQERREKEENEKIVEYIRRQDDKQQEIRENLMRKRNTQNEQQQSMCDQLNAIEQKKREHEELMIDLKSKEMRDIQDALDRVELEKRIRRRIITKMHLDDQKRDNDLRRLQCEDADRAFREEQMALLAERDRLELLSNERQRQKRIEHQRAVRQLMAKREEGRQDEVFKMIQEHQDWLAQERRRQEIFNEERRKIIQKHADDLLGFLPAELLIGNDSDMGPR